MPETAPTNEDHQPRPRLFDVRTQVLYTAGRYFTRLHAADMASSGLTEPSDRLTDSDTTRGGLSCSTMTLEPKRDQLLLKAIGGLDKVTIHIPRVPELSSQEDQQNPKLLLIETEHRDLRVELALTQFQLRKVQLERKIAYSILPDGALILLGYFNDNYGIETIEEFKQPAYDTNDDAISSDIDLLRTLNQALGDFSLAAVRRG